MKNTLKRDKTLVENSRFRHWVGMRNISDYSPFGVLLPERTSSTAFYRLGFQGQEHDDEVKGEGNSVNFKYRMHDPRVGRFFAVDPLAGKYPYNGPYNFSENRMLDGLEYEGLEVVLLNGTDMPSGTKWMLQSDAIREIKRIGGHSSSSKVEDFKWGEDNNYFNTRDGERKKAAHDLVDFVVEKRNEQLKANLITENEPITLFGYSNGGNVATQQTDEIERRTQARVQLITYGTPAYNDGSIEDPSTHKGISKHMNIYSDGDWVQGGLIGEKRYNNRYTVNYRLNQKLGHIEMGDMNKNKELGKFLKELPTMKDLPSFKMTKKRTDFKSIPSQFEYPKPGPKY